MKSRDKVRDLPESQLYQSRYATVQAYNKSLEDLYSTIRERALADKKRIRDAEKQRRKELKAYQGPFARIVAKVWTNTVSKFGEDWIFLAFLGTIVACISYSIDKGSMMCLKARSMLYSSELSYNMFSKWVAWVSIPFVLVLWDVGLIHLLAPKAVGSGIPQIKTCLRGVFLKEFLTGKLFFAKWLGVTATLGSGLPLGKEGPLIHMASVLATKMSKAIAGFQSVYMNENKKIEILGAAWAVGVACTFNSPIGGVLFSVETSTAYYAVRNYWRGFFVAVWGATTYRLLYVWIDGVDTIRNVFRAYFFVEFPYDPFELISFAIIGLICGFGGSFYIFCKQQYNKWAKNNKNVTRIKSLNQFIYPAVVILIISTVTWPPGIGQFMASDITGKQQVEDLFSNFTWTNTNHTIEQADILKHWTTKWSGVYTSLVVFFWYQFIFSIVGSSILIPNGSFIPNFRAGAALGRIAGELMALWFPDGVRYKGKITKIMPGAYATCGASAFSGAVTHTLSTSVIMFEMTSQITHVIPVLIANLIANGVARCFTPSIYDLVIQSAKLPYLPDLLPGKSAIYNVHVEDFMVTDVKYIFLGINYNGLKRVLLENKDLKMLPLVDNPHNMILLGSVSRQELIILLERQIGYFKRREILPSAIRKEDYDEEAERIKNEKEMSDIEKEEKRNKIIEKYDLNKSKQLLPKKDYKKKHKKDKKAIIRVCDLPEEQQIAWEAEQMAKEADLSQCVVDPAPFQLVERTSLLKVHSLFSLMAINTAYVTTIGKLIGVVGLTDLRRAIEDANAGLLPKRDDNGATKPLLSK